ncbi:MAG: transcriptional regulator [Planctomycetota bacterium]|nr:MAG: transcriptional regulator [Planctomycetota bacterium]
MDAAQFTKLVVDLAALDRETEWVEFKENNANPEDIGAYLSAIANSAALARRDRGYIVWGVRDGDHEVVGTTFRPHTDKVKGQELENWLVTLLSPEIHFAIHEGEIDDNPVVVFEVPAAAHTPVRFKDFEYIRVGSYKKKLRDHPEKERDLWRVLSGGSFEDAVAHMGASAADIIALLDHTAFFKMLSSQAPPGADAIVQRFVEEGLVKSRDDGRFDVLNIAAVLFARDLDAFGRLGRKAVRVVTYGDPGKTRPVREKVVTSGYAVGFQSVLDYIESQVPSQERIEHGLRVEKTAYPADAIRESIGNALIHQDFLMSGVGPMVDIFPDRIEITNSGEPLVDVRRFLDAPPRSRNESLAALMRRMRICEERGTGIDKVVKAAEDELLPAPDFQVVEGHTRAIINGPRAFGDMTKDERLRATYQHASLQWVSSERMTNASLRKRFGIARGNLSMVSRLISDALEAGLIKQYDPSNKSRRHVQYVPFWAT